MKAIRSIFVIAVLSTTPSSFALTETVGGITWTYTVTNGEARVTAVPTSSSGIIAIPSTLGGYSVTSIGHGALFCCNGLTSVTIPSSVTSVGDDAFYGCSSLASVTIPNGVTNIGYWAFYNCRSLKSVTIPSSVTNIGEGAFGGSGLKNVSISSSNMKYMVMSGMLLSKDGEKLIAVVENGFTGTLMIPDSVTRIGDSAFSGCNQLMSVTIPDSVKSIGGMAFYGCTGLTHVRIGNGITNIVNRTFSGCSSLTSVTIPDSVESINVFAFEYCGKLKTLYLSRNYVGSTDVFSSYASVDIIRYNPQQIVTFDVCGGMMVTTNVIVAYGAFYGSLPVPRREGYLFEGWTYDDRIIMTNTEVIALDDHTLIARWVPNQYMVTFDANGGVGGTSGIQDFGTSIIVPTVTRSGYIFKEWSPSIADTIPASNVTYVAIWTPNRYMVTFDANKGDGGICFVQDCGTAIVAPSVTRTGYTFNGWSPSVAATVPANDVTYTAQWTPNKYTVTFDSNCGTGGTSGKLDYESVLVAPTVTRTGYTFTGWSPSAPATVPLGGATYTAQWKINQYMVTFNANGGVGGTSGKQDYGTAIVAPTVTRTGYTFKGWSPSVAATVSAGNVTYTAQWEINKYIVTFDANGGECGTDMATVEYGSSVGALPVPTRARAAFLGWFTEAEGGVAVDASLVVTEPITLYAHWLTEVSSPVIATGGGTVFRTDSCEVTISCATEGVTIYYTDDGTTPRKSDDYLYTGPITITETTTFKAVAVIENAQSDYATVTITKNLLTLEEALDGGKSVNVATSTALPWTPVLDSSAKVGDATARSGAIGDRTNTWLSATVEGAGTMAFWCKVSCEHDDDNTFTWDRLMVYTNDIEITEWRMDGETDWTQRTLSFDVGTNVVKWVYFKDRSISEGEDCAWVDGVTWTLADVAVDVGGGKSVLVPMDWIDAHSNIVAAVGGDKSAAMKATAANGRKVWECYVLGLDPEKTDDFKITSFPMKSDGTPDLNAITFEPEQGQWKLSGAVPKLKGKATLDAEWQDVPPGGNPSFRFFTVEVQMP